MKELLWFAVCFLAGVAAQRVGTQVYARTCAVWQRWRQRRTERRQERAAQRLVMDCIDKSVQALAPQVWRQRRLADAPVTSSRSGWRVTV